MSAYSIPVRTSMKQRLQQWQGRLRIARLADWKWSVNLVRLLTVIATLATSLVTAASPASAFTTGIHRQIVADDRALGFLNSTTLSSVESGDVSIDLGLTFFQSGYHFDNCDFTEGIAIINQGYNGVVANLNPQAPDFKNAAKLFGKVLHTTQDFYSHSNWVESGQTTLFDTGLSYWNVIEPYVTVVGNNSVIVEGKTIRSGYVVSKVKADKTMTVTTPSGVTRSGIISGTFPSVSAKNCISRTGYSIPHGPESGNVGLNKDNPNRANFQSAYGLAVAQTRQEWCRLVSLVQQRYGAASVQALVSAWVKAATVAPCVPVITLVDPNSGGQGQTGLSVAITGDSTHFAAGTSAVSFGSGITVGTVTVTDATHLTAQLSIDAAAALGARTVTVTTGAEVASLASGFTVTAGTPIITVVNPNSGQPGQTGLGVAITGQFTHFAAGTSAVSFGSGITVGAVTVTDATHLTAQLSIDAAAALGARAVTVTTGAEVASLANGFTVQGGKPAVRLNPFGNQTIDGPYNIEVVTTQQTSTPAPGDITVTLLRDVISQCSGFLFSSNRTVVVSQGQSSATYNFNAGHDPACNTLPIKTRYTVTRAVLGASTVLDLSSVPAQQLVLTVTR